MGVPLHITVRRHPHLFGTVLWVLRGRHVTCLGQLHDRIRDLASSSIGKPVEVYVMRAWELGRIAARTLAAQRSRAILTMISIAVGAFSIVVMYSLADSGLGFCTCRWVHTATAVLR